MLTRGSEWRRWDLHVHTLDTALNDQFRIWDEYLAVINGQNEVRVIGVTDYLLFSNYAKIRQYHTEGNLPEVDLLIPNIEFCIVPPTEKATALNIHLLISPEDPEHEQQIHNTLARLTWKYGGDNYSCLREQLIALGKAFDPKVTDEGVALEKGVMQFKVDFSAFRDWYNDEPWLRENSLRLFMDSRLIEGDGGP